VGGHREGEMALVNQNPSVFDDDEEAPISFKRSSNSVKSRPTPSKQEGSSGNAAPVRNPKPAASNPQKNGVTSPSRLLHLKPQSVSPNHRPSGSNQPNSSSDHTLRNNNTVSSKLKRPFVKDEQPDDSDDDKPIRLRKKAEEKKLKRVDVGGEKAGDSDEDHKPLSIKMNLSRTPSSSKDRAIVLKAAPKVEQPVDDDSDDEKPLASRLPTNAVPKSGRNASDSEDEKPLSSRFSKVTGTANLKSGSSNNVTNGPQSLGKRPLVSNTQTSSAFKKAKPSGVSASTSVKKESKVDDNDNLPLAQRLKMGESSKSKTPVKNIVKKSPACLKKNGKKMKAKVKTKKLMKKSQFSKTLKVPPGSGGGTKWATLEHNGVIFPPPYKPHGVKMLYNGKPVDLTPEQEEVTNGALVLFLFFLQVWICNNNNIITMLSLELNRSS
jgi:DNA topoisomerase I